MMCMIPTAIISVYITGKDNYLINKSAPAWELFIVKRKPVFKLNQQQFATRITHCFQLIVLAP